jgi:hypothetical protein
MALINKSEHVYWELVPLEGTPRWRSFIRNACRIGLPVIFHKGGSSGQVHEEAEDVDEGDVVKKGEVVKKGKVLKKGSNKRRKKGILRVSRHLVVILSLVLLMREKETQR